MEMLCGRRSRQRNFERLELSGCHDHNRSDEGRRELVGGARTGAAGGAVAQLPVLRRAQRRGRGWSSRNRWKFSSEELLEKMNSRGLVFAFFFLF